MKPVTLPPHLVLDLDGTLLDIRKKYFTVYRERLKGKLSEPEFWRFKRARKLPSFGPDIFGLLESEPYLSIDTLFPFSVQLLNKLTNQHHILHLVSARRNTDAGLQQIKRLGIAKFFTTVDISYNGVSGESTKTEIIAKLLPDGVPFAAVGDTEDDIRAAKACGGIAIAVTSGIRNTSLLEKCSPDLLLPNAGHLLDFARKDK